MLTADLVHARRRGKELVLSTLDDGARQRAVDIAAELISRVRGLVGRSREEVDAALKAVDVAPRECRLRDALSKLVVDRCQFDSADDVDVIALRRDVFTRASALRSALPAGERFDRTAVIAAVAAERETTPEAIERLLFADLRGAQRLRACEAPDAWTLVSAYPRAQAQAVLLRAVRVSVDVQCASAYALRAFFQRLKFLRLIHTICRAQDGHRILIDGPFSLFESVTKYGLQLALIVPLLEDCEAWSLSADIRWGKDKTPLEFRMAGGYGTSPEAEKVHAVPSSSDEVQALVRSFEGLGTDWHVSAASEIVDLPGVGLCIPDLVFERRGDKAAPVRVFLEVMGYWSRSAVWRRIELVQGGLREKILFAVSVHLRVSEEALGDDVPGALYVYKRTMSARSVLERIERLAKGER
ncbi:MAG: DUF790 family protein [Polyangiaceae bacterium]